MNIPFKIPHDYSYFKGSISVTCKRCGHTIHINELVEPDIVAVVLKLIEPTCDLNYNQIKSIYEYMTVQEVHES
jgi:hypothetical protein